MLAARRPRARHGQDLLCAFALLNYALQMGSSEEDKLMSLYELGLAFYSQYSIFRSLDALSLSIDAFGKALKLAPEDHPVRCRIAIDLSHSYHVRWQWKMPSEDEDAREQRRLMDEAFPSCPPGHIYRANALHRMGLAYSVDYSRTGELPPLDRTIKSLREALAAIPQQTHSLHVHILENLSINLRERFALDGSISDLSDAIAAGQGVLSHRPNSERALHTLEQAFFTRFLQQGDFHDLEDCMHLCRRLLALCQPGHPLRYLALQTAAQAIVLRAEQTSDANDLQEASILLKESISLLKPESPEWILGQFSLAHTLMSDHKLSPNSEYLEEAFKIHTLCLNRRLDWDMKHWGQAHFMDIADLRCTRYKTLRDVQDLHMAIECQEEALRLKGEEYFDRWKPLDILASAYRMRAEALNSTEDAQQALVLQKKALSGLQIGQRERAQVLLGLARLYLLPMLHEYNIHTAVELYCTAIADTHCSARVRLFEGLDVLTLFKLAHERGQLGASTSLLLLDAYRLTIDLLPRIAYFGLDAHSRFKILSMAPTLAVDAAIYALSVHNEQASVELLEAGRAVFWSQSLRLRSSFDQLPKDLAAELSETARALNADARRVNQPSRLDGSARADYEDQVARTRRLGEAFEALVVKARYLPGFECFMLNDTYAALSMAALTAPVVVLLARTDFCGAIIIEGPNVSAKQLVFGPLINIERLKRLAHELRNTRQTTRNAVKYRVMRKTTVSQKSQNQVLAELWHSILKDLIKALSYKVCKSLDLRK